MNRLLRPLLVLLLVLLPAGVLSAEKAANLPKPTSYVSDFAGVMSPTARQQVEALCTQLDQQTHAQIAVVTIKTLDDDQTIEEFSTELEDKWKVGDKSDRGLLMVLSMQPRKIRVEVGYGLEGALNDAKVGAILDQMKPSLRMNDYDTGIPLGVQSLAQVVAGEAGVTLQPIVPAQHTYRRVDAGPRPIGIGQIIFGIIVVLIVVTLIGTGNIGWLFVLLNMFMGGGGGGRDDDDRGGGGFGGFGGGSSGGGGASRDF